MLQKEQWLEVGAMQIDDEQHYDMTQISALEIELPLPETKERTKEKALIDDKYQEICNKVSTEGNVNKEYTIGDDILCWKNRFYVPEGLRQRIINLEHDSQVAAHFGRERTLQLITRTVYWTNMERDIQKYSNECDFCQWTKSPRHAKHGLLHLLELAFRPWTHISAD